MSGVPKCERVGPLLRTRWVLSPPLASPSLRWPCPCGSTSTSPCWPGWPDTLPEHASGSPHSSPNTPAPCPSARSRSIQGSPLQVIREQHRIVPHLLPIQHPFPPPGFIGIGFLVSIIAPILYRFFRIKKLPTPLSLSCQHAAQCVGPSYLSGRGPHAVASKCR